MDPRADSSSRRRGSYAKGVTRRREILDSAIRVFAERGSGQTSLRAIAESVGVTHAALIHHFGTLEKLLVEVYLESERRIGVDHPTPDAASPVEVMRLSAQRNRTIPGMVQLYTSLVAAALEDGHPTATALISGRFASIRVSLADRVRMAQRAGELRSDLDADQVAALVVAASDGLQTQWLLDPEVDQVATLALLDRLLRPADAPDQMPRNT